MLLLYITLAFWIQLEPSLNHKELMEQVAEANYEFTMRVFRMKIGNSEEVGKQRLKISVVAISIIIGIALSVYIGLFLSYVADNFLWIIYHFNKLTRISGVIIFIGGMGLLIRHIYKMKKEKVSHITNITIMGLIIENILISMIVFIF